MKKAQMKVQEIAFVLVGLILLFSMVFIFYIKLQSPRLEQTMYEVEQERAKTLLEKLCLTRC